jgi:hypothetical protein
MKIIGVERELGFESEEKRWEKIWSFIAKGCLPVASSVACVCLSVNHRDISFFWPFHLREL